VLLGRAAQHCREQGNRSSPCSNLSEKWRHAG
jgi:hypothetical protein